MKKRVGILMLCLAFSLSVFTGCTGSATTAANTADTQATTKPSEKKDLRFVIVTKVVHPWYDEVNKGAVEEANALGDRLGIKITVDFITPTAADVTEQNSILEKAAATHPDGIAVDPLDAVGNRQVIDEIKKQGIPVVVFDAPAPENSDIPSIGCNFTEQGVIAAERLAKLLDGKGKVAIMTGVPTAPNHQERFQAQVDTLKKYPGITIVDGGIDNDDIQTAQQQCAAVLAANPDLKGYLMCDASAPMGIAAAIKEAGKKGKVIAVGMDGIKPILEAVKEGVLESSSASIPRMQGSMSLLVMYQASMGLRTPKSVDTGIDLITPENVDSFLALEE
ncbi:MAG: substrate-binding domain-containing protein [Ruminiclostridium sp.]